MKKGIWLTAAAVIVIALFMYFKPDNEQGELKELRTERVQRGDLSLTVAATGTITPFIEVELKSKAGGEIIAFPYQEGDRLKKGDAVVRLDPETEKSRVNQANANLLIAEAKLEKAEINLEDEELRLTRQENLFEDKVISRQELDSVRFEVSRAKSDLKIATAELIRARETLKEAKDRLTDTEIRAPLNGTILKKYVEEGQVIASTTSSASEGTLLLTMADLNRIYIEAMVDETDIGRVVPGQPVSITADAYPTQTFNGKVIRIAPKGRVESTITVFDVTIEVDDRSKRMLKPMMTANTEILTELKTDVLLVPSESIRQYNNEIGLYKATGNGPAWIALSTGSSDGILTEVNGEIKEGEEIVISGMEERDGGPGNSRNLRRGFRFLGRKK